MSDDVVARVRDAVEHIPPDGGDATLCYENGDAVQCSGLFGFAPLYVSDLGTILARLAAAEQDVARLTKWRPIATVPKDGAGVLVSFGGAGVWQVAWEPPAWGDIGDETWCVDDCKHGPYALRGYGYADGSCSPECWMPLPDVPAIDAARAERAE